MVHTHSTLDHATRVGELLIEAKGQLSHGEWLPWLETHCSLSPRVAQGYMRIARQWPQLLADPANTKRDSYLAIRDALTLLADEWTDPDERGAGGADDEDDEDDEGEDDEDEDDEDDDKNEDDDDQEDDKDEHPKYIRMFRAFFEINEYAEFRKQFDEVKRLVRTHNDTDTLKKIVQLIHSALTTDNNNKTEDDADHPTHGRPLDAGR